MTNIRTPISSHIIHSHARMSIYFTNLQKSHSNLILVKFLRNMNKEYYLTESIISLDGQLILL